MYEYSPIMNYATRVREEIDLPYVGGASLEAAAGWVKYYVGDVLKDYAPLKSPHFTGSPTAPTPATGDKSTKIATTAFVDDAIKSALDNLDVTTVFTYKGSVENYSDLPASGNSTGDVWNIENADATHDVLAGDNVAWTGSEWDVLSGLMDLSGYAPIRSPNLTGVPTAPTAAKGTDTDQIATTAFVQDAVDGLMDGVVKTIGNQSISGTKTFNSSPLVPTASAGDSSTKAASTAFVQAAIANAQDDCVKTTGNQEIGGKKTFTTSPVAPTPAAGDNSTKVATTAYVQNAIANAEITAAVPVTKVSSTWPANASSVTVQDASITATNLVVMNAPTTEAAFDAIALAKVCATSQSAGRIVLTALGTAPTANTAFSVSVMGD